MEIKITDNGGFSKVAKELEKNSETYRKGIKLQMWRALTLLELKIIKNIRGEFTRRTGTLMNSVSPTKEVDDSGDSVVGRIGNSAPYSAQREWGGWIHAKKSRFLKFPHEDNMAPDGRAIETTLVKPVFIPLKKGGYLIAEQGEYQGKGQPRNDLPRFWLKESVYQKENSSGFYMGPAVESMKDRIAEEFGLFIKATFGKGG